MLTKHFVFNFIILYIIVTALFTISRVWGGFSS